MYVTVRPGFLRCRAASASDPSVSRSQSVSSAVPSARSSRSPASALATAVSSTGLRTAGMTSPALRPSVEGRRGPASGSGGPPPEPPDSSDRAWPGPRLPRMRLDVTTVVVSPFEQNCRIVKDLDSGDGVIVDPGDEPERILEAVRASGARITHILATHAHLDHVGAAAEVRRALGVPFCLHRGDLPLLKVLPQHGAMFGMDGLEVPTVDVDLSGVKELPLGKGKIRVLHTPGHTPGGCTF